MAHTEGRRKQKWSADRGGGRSRLRSRRGFPPLRPGRGGRSRRWRACSWAFSRDLGRGYRAARGAAAISLGWRCRTLAQISVVGALTLALRECRARQGLEGHGQRTALLPHGRGTKRGTLLGGPHASNSARRIARPQSHGQPKLWDCTITPCRYNSDVPACCEPSQRLTRQQQEFRVAGALHATNPFDAGEPRSTSLPLEHSRNRRPLLSRCQLTALDGARGVMLAQRQPPFPMMPSNFHCLSTDDLTCPQSTAGLALVLD